MSLGAAYLDRRKLKLAKIYYGKAWDLFKALENQVRNAQLLNHLGRLSEIQGNLPSSIKFYKQALHLAQTALPDSPNFSARQAALHNLGYAYMSQKAYEAAIKTFQKGLSLKPLRIEIEVAMLNSLGAAQWKFGKAEDAKRTLQRAEELARQNHLLPRWWRILFFLGHVYLTQQQPDTAQNCWERAIETIEQLRYDLGGADRDRIRFMVDKHTVYADMVELLIQQGDTAKAFEYVQRAKARTFLDMLYGSGIYLRVGVDSALLDKEQELQRAIATTRIQWIETQQDRLEEQITKLEADLMRVRDLILEQNPKFHKLFRGQMASATEIQSQLNDRTILLEYFVAEEKIFLFGVSKDGIQNYELPIAPNELNTKITKLRDLLQAPVPTGHTAGPAYSSFVETSLELYQHLVKPAEEILSQTDHLVIAPHDILYAVPFAALVVGKKTSRNAEDPDALDNYQGLDYLIQNYSLSYIPSATVLLGLSPKKTTVGKILAFGQPSTSKNSSVGKGEIEMLSQLPYAEVYKEKNATETRLKTSPLEKIKILHLATHAIFNDTDPFLSYVELEPTNNPLEDGRLHAYEVLHLTLKSALVILSACSTGQRPSSKGEGMVSLTRAFLASGTPTVLSTLWQIEDTPTEHLMRVFYASLSPNVEAAAALRKSQLALIQSSLSRKSRRGSRNLAHPHFWAGFVLIGRF